MIGIKLTMSPSLRIVDKPSNDAESTPLIASNVLSMSRFSVFEGLILAKISINSLIEIFDSETEVCSV